MCSSAQQIKYGVPQGPERKHMTLKDLCFEFSYKPGIDSYELKNSIVCSWMKANKLSVNIKKTNNKQKFCL